MRVLARQGVGYEDSTATPHGRTSRRAWAGRKSFRDKGIRPPEWKWGDRRGEGTEAQPSPDFRILSLMEKVMLRGEKAQW